MNKNRLEAFSDGVFAIAITLLILDIRLPDVKSSELPGALWDIMPRILAYVMSFVLIGAYWVFHHYYFEKIKKVNGTFLFINILNLMVISFMPFPTALMGRYPMAPFPIIIYGATLIASNLSAWLALYYLYKHPDMAEADFGIQFFKNSYRMYIPVNVAYLLALPIAFVYPWVSYGIYVLVLVAVSIMVARRINRSYKVAC